MHVYPSCVSCHSRLTGAIAIHSYSCRPVTLTLLPGDTLELAEGDTDAVALPLGVMWGLGALAWLQAEPAARDALLWGQTWRVCAFNIAGIALPVFAGLVLALRGLAPTRPVLAGAAAGLAAGAAGAAVYALHCPELGAPFIAVWYSAGMALTTVAGAAAGARWLRW